MRSHGAHVFHCLVYWPWPGERGRYPAISMSDQTINMLKRCAGQILVNDDEDDDQFPLSKVAISVFDRWLGKKNLHLLDCKDDAERQDRNRRMLALWMAIYDSYDVLCRTKTDDFEPTRDRTEYETACAYDGDRPSNEFQCILIPERSAIYYENWDDTNVLWYMDRKDIVPIIELAETCGLHAIEFAG